MTYKDLADLIFPNITKSIEDYEISENDVEYELEQQALLEYFQLKRQYFYLFFLNQSTDVFGWLRLFSNNNEEEIQMLN